MCSSSDCVCHFGHVIGLCHCCNSSFGRSSQKNAVTAIQVETYLHMFALWLRHSSIHGVAEKHDFRGIQGKIPQISDFAKNRDLNPPSHGDTAADIAKIGFWVKKHNFRENPIDNHEIPRTLSQKSDSLEKSQKS
jgi:hypothetical protein